MRTWATLGLLLMAGSVAASARADVGAVRTLDGQVFRGEIQTYRAGDDVRVFLRTGEVVEVPHETVSRVDLRLQPLDPKPSLVGPLLLMPAGLAVLGLGGALTALSTLCFAWAEDCDEDEELRAIGIGVGVLGGLAFLAGALLLPIQVAKRRAWRERHRSDFRITPCVDHRGASISLGAAF